MQEWGSRKVKQVILHINFFPVNYERLIITFNNFDRLLCKSEVRGLSKQVTLHGNILSRLFVHEKSYAPHRSPLAANRYRGAEDYYTYLLTWTYMPCWKIAAVQFVVQSTWSNVKESFLLSRTLVFKFICHLKNIYIYTHTTFSIINSKYAISDKYMYG